MRRGESLCAQLRRITISRSYGHARIPASKAGDFAERVLELTKEFEFEHVPGEKVYGFLAAVFLTNQPELPEEGEGP